MFVTEETEAVIRQWQKTKAISGKNTQPFSIPCLGAISAHVNIWTFFFSSRFRWLHSRDAAGTWRRCSTFCCFNFVFALLYAECFSSIFLLACEWRFSPIPCLSACMEKFLVRAIGLPRYNKLHGRVWTAKQASGNVLFLWLYTYQTCPDSLEMCFIYYFCDFR